MIIHFFLNHTLLIVCVYLVRKMGIMGGKRGSILAEQLAAFFFVQVREKQVIRLVFPKLWHRDFQWSLWSFLEVPKRNTLESIAVTLLHKRSTIKEYGV